MYMYGGQDLPLHGHAEAAHAPDLARRPRGDHYSFFFFKFY